MKRILCFFGWHQWTASIQDYIEEFGYLPLGNVIASNATCERCKCKFKQQKDGK
jgi:hypothetical protein